MICVVPSGPTTRAVAAVPSGISSSASTATSTTLVVATELDYKRAAAASGNVSLTTFDQKSAKPFQSTQRRDQRAFASDVHEVATPRPVRHVARSGSSYLPAASKTEADDF